MMHSCSSQHTPLGTPSTGSLGGSAPAPTAQIQRDSKAHIHNQSKATKRKIRCHTHTHIHTPNNFSAAIYAVGDNATTGLSTVVGHHSQTFSLARFRACQST